MEQLPIDIIGDILLYIDVKDQYQVRRVNKKFSKVDVKQCKIIPSITEIVNWSFKENESLTNKKKVEPIRNYID